MKFYLLAALFFSLFTINSAFAKSCQEVRLGLDIGSGSTKMMVAKVDFCQNIILEVLLHESQPIAYNEDLERSSDGHLSPAIIEKGYETLKLMLLKAKTFKPQKSYGVATSVFRKAKNGKAVIKSFAIKLKTRLEVISQVEEATLGFLAAKSVIDKKMPGDKKIIVWDIGGGSMQMFGLDEKKRPLMYLGDLASVTFKNMVIEVIERKNPDTVFTPNPIKEHREQAIALARAYAKLHVPAVMKKEIKNRVVVGIGGVHTQSIKNQLQLKEMDYTQADLDKASREQVLKTDAELLGDYKSTDVTNLLLVQGFMEALGLNVVHIVNASLIQGVMFQIK